MKLTNRQFSEKDKAFKDAVWTANMVLNIENKSLDSDCFPKKDFVRPTARQASKFRRGVGIAYTVGRVN